MKSLEMKTAIFLVLFGLVNACKFKDKNKAKELIKLNYVETNNYYNFKSLEITFPRLDEIFKCVTNVGDMVDVEIQYKYGNDEWETLEKLVLKHEFPYGERTVKLVTPSKNAEIARSCEGIQIKLRVKEKGSSKNRKNLKLPSFQFGPGLLEISIDEITNATAKVHFNKDDPSQACASGYDIEISDDIGPIGKVSINLTLLKFFLS